MAGRAVETPLMSQTNALGQLQTIVNGCFRDELHIAPARLFNGPARDQALAVGEQDNLEHDMRIVGIDTHLIIPELSVHGGEGNFMIDQVVQREAEAAGDDLLTEHHGQQQAIVL